MSPRARALALTATVAALIAAAWLAFGATIRRYDQDLDVFVLAGARALAGEDLYRPGDGYMPFKYAPATAFLFAPLVALPPEARSPAWFVLSMTALAGAIILFWSGALRRPLPATWREAVPLVAAVLGGLAFVVRLARNGQTDGLVLLLCVASGVAADRGVAGAAAGAWVAATALKLAPAVLGLYLARRRALRVLGWSVALTLLIALAPVAPRGPAWTLRQYTGWWVVLGANTPGDLDYFSNQSASALGRRLSTVAGWPPAGTPALRSAVVSGLLAAVALGLVLVTLRRAPDDAEGRSAALAAVLVLVPILSPISWAATCVAALPAFIVLLATRPLAFRRRGEDALLALAVLASNVWGGRDFQALGPRLWGLLALLLALASRARGLAAAYSSGAGRPK